LAFFYHISFWYLVKWLDMVQHSLEGKIAQIIIVISLTAYHELMIVN
jgi:hypothetical protein